MKKKLFTSQKEQKIASKLPLNYSLIETVSNDIINLSKEYLDGAEHYRPAIKYQSNNVAIYMYPNLISKSLKL